MYKILYIISGDVHPFAVEIDETKTVYDLKSAIKKEQPALDTVLTRKLQLYRIDVKSIEEAKQISQNWSRNKSHNTRLWASCLLSTALGPTGLSEEMIYILVDFAKGELTD